MACGLLCIANPDLVEGLELDAPINEPKLETFYGSSPEGYIDYPTL